MKIYDVVTTSVVEKVESRVLIDFLNEDENYIKKIDSLIRDLTKNQLNLKVCLCTVNNDEDSISSRDFKAKMFGFNSKDELDWGYIEIFRLEKTYKTNIFKEDDKQ